MLKFITIAEVVALAALMATASPASAQGPSFAAAVDIAPLLALSRIEIERSFPDMTVYEIDLLMHRIGEARSMERLPATDH